MLTLDKLSLFDSDKTISCSIYGCTLIKLIKYDETTIDEFFKTLVGFTRLKKCSVIWHINQKKDILFINEKIGIYEKLKIIDILKYWACLYNTQQALPIVIKLLQLEDLLQESFEKLQPRLQQKVILSKALFCQCDVWILNNPFLHITEDDFITIREIFYTKYNQGGLIFIRDDLDKKIDYDIKIDLLNLNIEYF